MKTNHVGGSSTKIGHDRTGLWVRPGGNTPPFNKHAALPKNMNKPFIKRFIEWWTS